jgi:peptidoglycan/LPS O-acetylase OafA/YrhL
LNSIPNLDFGRGLAALTVCLFHAAGFRFPDQQIGELGWVSKVILNGHGAVILFFVLSGFVLRVSLENRKKFQLFTISTNFLIARIFRLFPVIVATVFVFALIAMLVSGQAVQLIDLIRNAVLLDITINSVFWTLQVEVLGSALILIAFLVERQFGFWLVPIMTGCLLPLSFAGSTAPVYSGLLYTFLCGYLVATIPKRPTNTRQLLAILLVAGIAFYAANAFGYVYKQWLLLITAAAASGIVYALSHLSQIQPAPAHWLGALSYSFYALHPIAIDMAQFICSTNIPLMLVTVLLSITMAIPMMYFVERPGILLGKLITRAS